MESPHKKKNPQSPGAKSRKVDCAETIAVECGDKSGEYVISRNKILCLCCNEKMTLSKFAEHSGSTNRQPRRAIYLKGTDQSIHEWDCRQKNSGPGQIMGLSPLLPTCAVGGNTDDAVCAVCYNGDSEKDNEIVFCEKCDVAVHQVCYGVKEIPAGQWFCAKCASPDAAKITCALCPFSDGALKPTSDGQWAHLACAIWIPETCVADTATMQPITNVDKISKERLKLTCSVCKTKTGACIQCTKHGCGVAFHPLCGRASGFVMEMSEKSPTDDHVTLIAYCAKHSQQHFENRPPATPLAILPAAAAATESKPRQRRKSAVESLQSMRKAAPQLLDDDDHPLPQSPSLAPSEGRSPARYRGEKSMKLESRRAPTNKPDEDGGEGEDFWPTVDPYFEIFVPNQIDEILPEISHDVADECVVYYSGECSAEQGSPLPVHAHVESQPIADHDLPPALYTTFSNAYSRLLCTYVPNPNESVTIGDKVYLDEVVLEDFQVEEGPSDDKPAAVDEVFSDVLLLQEQLRHVIASNAAHRRHVRAAMLADNATLKNIAHQKSLENMYLSFKESNREMNRPRGSGEDDIPCAVCKDGDYEDWDLIVFCDRCEVAVHQSCYGIREVPEGNWFCQPCTEAIAAGHADDHPTPPDCVLCPTKGGALRRTNDRRWAHVACALWVPEVTIDCIDGPTPIKGINNIPKDRWNLTCTICMKKEGAPIQCCSKSCLTAFHPLCARSTHLPMSMDDGSGNSDVIAFRAYCSKHNPPIGTRLGGSFEQVSRLLRWNMPQQQQNLRKKKKEKREEFQTMVKEMQSLMNLRMSLEKARILCDVIKRREKQKKAVLKMELEIFEDEVMLCEDASDDSMEGEDDVANLVATDTPAEQAPAKTVGIGSTRKRERTDMGGSSKKGTPAPEPPTTESTPSLRTRGKLHKSEVSTPAHTPASEKGRPKSERRVTRRRLV